MVLQHIDEPSPRGSPLEYSEFAWRVSSTFAPRTYPEPADISFSEVVELRRSRRNLRPAKLSRVLDLVRYSTRARFKKEETLVTRHKSPVISAGALHSISCLVISPLIDRYVIRYCIETDQFQCIRTYEDGVNALRVKSRSVLPECCCHLICFLAHHGMTEAFYENPTTLLWREAGAVQQLISMAAQAFGLQTCPIGAHGHEILSALGGESQLTSVGLMAAGSALSPTGC